ncbi:MAG: hypothetical protein ACLRVU_09670 [Beduini sp.]|uniref:hypothetical protein n=1 Tax=Beduini sp. TaxID=1922300 RepID=UPI0039A245B0
MTYDELKRALLTIKEECKRNYNCDSCMVKQLIGEYCQRKTPEQWYFKEKEEICCCDRCGKEIKDYTTYTVEIGALETTAGISADGAIENIETNASPAIRLCKECKDEIKKFVYKKVIEK